MREINFRAWFKEEKEMREVAMLRWEDGRISRIAGYWKETRNNGWTDYDPQEYKVVLMQDTGLKDRNGKEIYEGDILKSSYTEFGHEVVFKNGGFHIQHNDRCCPPYGTSPSEAEGWQEVVGNIYENSELLK